MTFLGYWTHGFSYLPSFHFQSSLPINIIDGPGLGVTKHCKRKVRQVYNIQNSLSGPDNGISQQTPTSYSSLSHQSP